MNIESLIKGIRDIDESISFICSNGACYKFAKYIQSFFILCELYISQDKEHVIVKYENEFYDISGKCSGIGYTLITPDEETICAKWSFNKKYFVGKECAYCGEIIE